jgi:hypothetical protein
LCPDRDSAADRQETDRGDRAQQQSTMKLHGARPSRPAIR